MGKNFPLIKNLKAYPQYWDQTVTLIEKSFNYSEVNSFEKDFITLMCKENGEHLYILVENEEVVAHLGVKIRQLNIESKKINIAMMGGIAVSETHRGKGYFSYLMNEIKKIHSENVAAFILWSDQPELYAKHDFILCGPQYSLVKRKEKKTFKHLSKPNILEQKEIKDIHSHFFNNHYAYIERTESDWKNLFDSSSCKIWVNDLQKITSYFVEGKGQDLKNIIHEHATIENRTDFLKTISHFGEVWMTKDYFHEGNAHFQFLMCSGGLFDKLVSLISKNEIKFLGHENEMCHFIFKENEYVISKHEFYGGTFGPNYFSEFKNNLDIFITGWDSI